MYPTYTRQGLTGIIGAAGARQVLNGLNVQINAQTFGATGNGNDDDTTKIQAALDYASSLPGRKVVVIPHGDYLIQDPSSAAHTAQADGVLRIAPGVSGLTIWGYGARLILGPRGAGTAMLRIFGGKINVFGLELDLNGTIPDPTKNNVGIQIAGTHSDSEEDVDACDCLVQHNYIHGSRYRDEYTTGTITYDHTGNAAGERVVVLTGSTWPTLAATNGAIRISGTWYEISARVSDTVLQLGSAVEDNPGSDVGSTSYVFRNEPYKSQSRDGIQVLNGFRNKIWANTFLDIGWTAVRTSGGDNHVAWNNAKDFRGYGYRGNEHTGKLIVEENLFESQYCSGRSCLLVDPGSAEDSSATTNNDVRCESFESIRNVCRCTTDGDMEGAGSAMKIAAVRSCVVDGGEYNAGIQTNNNAIRLEDCITKIQFKGDYRIIGRIDQAPVLRGTVSAHTSLTAGTSMSLTVPASHGLVVGKSIYITNSQIARLNNREFIVTAVNGNDITIGYVSDEDGTVTAMPYVAGTITNTQVHGGTHELIMRGGVIQRGQHDTNYGIYGLFAPLVDIEGVKMEMVEEKSALVKEGMINFAYASDLGIELVRIVKNEFQFNTDKLSRVLRCDSDNLDSSAAALFLTAGKFICYGNRMSNKHTGTVLLVNIYETNDSTASYDDRLIIFSTVGEDKDTYWGTGTPSESVVTFADGQRIRNSAPAAGGAPGWICTTPGKSGTFRAEANVA